MGITKKEKGRDGLILAVILTKPFGSKHGSKKKKRGLCLLPELLSSQKVNDYQDYSYYKQDVYQRA